MDSILFTAEESVVVCTAGLAGAVGCVAGYVAGYGWSAGATGCSAGCSALFAGV